MTLYHHLGGQWEAGEVNSLQYLGWDPSFDGKWSSLDQGRGCDSTMDPEKRANYPSRVFQDPKMGTAPRMTVAGKSPDCKLRGESGVWFLVLAHHKDEFKEVFEPD